MELGNLADEQAAAMSRPTLVPPRSFGAGPSHTARRVALTRSYDCREAPPLPFITLPYTDGHDEPHIGEPIRRIQAVQDDTMLVTINGDSNITSPIPCSPCRNTNWGNNHLYYIRITRASQLPSQAQTCQIRHAHLHPSCPGPNLLHWRWDDVLSLRMS